MDTEEKNTKGEVKILWVEDDSFLGSLIAKKLSGNGYDVTYVATGEDALEHVKNNKPNLVLSDIMLPGIDGFEILKTLKSNDETKDIPVILFSNLNQEDDMKKGKDLGAEFFLVKSNVVPDQIVSKIQELLSSR